MCMCVMTLKNDENYGLCRKNNRYIWRNNREKCLELQNRIIGKKISLLGSGLHNGRSLVVTGCCLSIIILLSHRPIEIPLKLYYALKLPTFCFNLVP